MRHTKIIATVGPACDSEEMLAKLLRAGVDIFRLNFSHGTHDSHAGTVRRIRAASAATGRRVSILQDLSGPKIRTGPVDGAPLMLVNGSELRIAVGDEPGEPGRVFTPYAPLVDNVRPGDRLLLDDGKIELRVTGREKGELVTTVLDGGPLAGKKGINAPGVPLPASALTEKDIADLHFGLSIGVDLVAMSFVQTAEDVERGQAAMASEPRRVPIIAKIERPSGVDHLDAILQVADAIMVARGDLGLEMPLEQVPRIQKEIIRRSRIAGRPVILATQVLESMRTDPRPTRAEVSDAAKAVDEGADAIMLSGETAAGAFPVKAVEALDAVIADAESVPHPLEMPPASNPTGSRHGRALCEAAVTLATTGQAAAIVAVTAGGKTARMLSSLRPAAPVVAAIAREDIAAALALCWGVRPMLTAARALEVIGPQLLAAGHVQAGQTVVYVSVSPDLTRPDANFLKVRRVGG